MKLGMLLMIGLIGGMATAARAGDLFAMRELERTPQKPTHLEEHADQHWFVDFGKDAFGWLEIEIDAPADGSMTVWLGEKATEFQSVDRNPGGSIRAAEVTVAYTQGKHRYRVETTPDKRNTHGAAATLPAAIGVVLPFRYVEISHCPVHLNAAMVTRVMVNYPFDDAASAFISSDDRLNAVWDLCKHSIKATSFAGIFLDGDRERIPYEADAYLNQLSWYCTDGSIALPRHSHEYLLTHPTWPTEWKQFSVLMAFQDWMYSGNLDSIRRNYELLKKEKMQFKSARADGLIDSSKLKDVVDWPAGERDGFVMSPVNTVVNAFHYRTIMVMAEMAAALGKQDEQLDFASQSLIVKAAFNNAFLDPATGLYCDGEGVKHSSLHASLFALAFDLVDEQHKPKVIEFIKSRGMGCSVYPAQFLLEGLFKNGEAEYAISLMTSGGERSWRHMLDFGSTITTEAWDIKFKSNMDWNHAWGAAPANIIPRYVLGVRPLEAGFAKSLIAPQIGKLTHVEGIVPTILGPVGVKISGSKLVVQIPDGMNAQVKWLGATHDVGPGEHTYSKPNHNEASGSQRRFREFLRGFNSEKTRSRHARLVAAGVVGVGRGDVADVLVRQRDDPCLCERRSALDVQRCLREEFRAVGDDRKVADFHRGDLAINNWVFSPHFCDVLEFGFEHWRPKVAGA